MDRLLKVVGGTTLVLALSLPASAQVGANFVLRSGERVSGSLVDMGGSGFAVERRRAVAQLVPGRGRGDRLHGRHLVPGERGERGRR